MRKESLTLTGDDVQDVTFTLPEGCPSGDGVLVLCAYRRPLQRQAPTSVVVRRALRDAVRYEVALVDATGARQVVADHTVAAEDWAPSMLQTVTEPVHLDAGQVLAVYVDTSGPVQAYPPKVLWHGISAEIATDRPT